MPKPDKKQKRPDDVIQLPSYSVEEVTQSNDSIPPATKSQISKFMAELGRKGGKIGGKRRMETMSAKERKEVARKAAQARWNQKED
jgi:hypothetical protein